MRLWCLGANRRLADLVPHARSTRWSRLAWQLLIRQFDRGLRYGIRVSFTKICIFDLYLLKDSNRVELKRTRQSVLFVTHTDHRYLSHATDREEGGTPDILGNIRLGLAFQVKQRVGEQAILELEHANMRRAFASLSANENIVLLGRSDVDKLPIFSFLVRFHDRFLHYNFVCALLNDLFGVQSRGGCQCAGPYAARLLGIELDDLGRFTDALVDGQGALKPGFTRMSFPYFMDARELDYILDAVHFVATDGWKFLPQYRCDLATGSWAHFMSVDEPLQLAHLDGFASTTF